MKNIRYYVKKSIKKYQHCGGDGSGSKLRAHDDVHTVYFKATEEKHRYRIETHACKPNTCYAAYKKGIVNKLL